MKTYIKLLAVLTLVAACSKDDENQPTPTVSDKGGNVLLTFAVDGQPLQFDGINYVNAAGNNYGVTRLQFYLSGFTFESASGSLYQADKVFYLDARAGTNTKMTFGGLPYDTYKRISFYVGLDAAHNTAGSLPATLENTNMVWPEPMGGGYHFMKLEGNFLAQGNTFGYAMHLGKTGFHVTADVTGSFTIGADSKDVNLEMNINEWFTNPVDFDFNVDGNYTMGDSTAMSKLQANGANAFTIK